MGQSSHTFINMKRVSLTQVVCLGHWEKRLDCLLPLSLVLSMDSHREEASVAAAPISGLARKHETQFLLKQTPAPVLLLC